MADLTPAQLLAATAADMRRVADAAHPGPWTVRTEATMFYGVPSACVMVPFGGIAGATQGLTRYEPLGTEDGETVIHIAAWDPVMARAVAGWLEAKARKYARHDPAEQARMVDAGVGTLAPMLVVCRAWWASRGAEPPGGVR